MILDFIGILFIALGIFGLHQAIERGKEDKETIILLAVSLILIFVGGIIFIGKISIEILMRRI
ncbi:MAG: hypothetical protein QXJ25_03440, partial [Candidatus Aenigmatarchaeota archaeon]